MIVRKFYPGNEWLYLKIYTGVTTSDIILLETLKPLVEELQCENVMANWFFIRYNDPKPHLRLRFQLVNSNHYNEVLENINNSLSNFINSGEIANIIIDTYVREIERYGENTIENAEELFFKSSNLILNFLEYNDEEKIIVTLFYIDCILSELKLPANEKLEWISDFNNSFKKEFNADKNLNSQLDKKFREFKPKYFDFINSDEFEEIRNLIKNNISETTLMFEKILELEKSDSLKAQLGDFFQSIFHMHINRLFISSQRLFEMIIYDHFFRFYKVLNFNKLK